MAKSVDPFAKKNAPKPDPAKQQELLARATGAGPAPGQPARRPVLPTPKPASPLPPGVTGTPPLPTGKVVGHLAPSSLTAAERESLAAIGWSEDMPLPTSQEGIKQLQAEVAQMQAIEVPLPVDPRTPAFKPPEAVPMHKLPAEQQNALRAKLANISKQEEEARREAARQADIKQKEQSVKGLGKASAAANAAVRGFEEKLAARAASAPPQEFEVTADEAPPVPEYTPPPPVEPTPVERAIVEEVSKKLDETAARLPHAHSDTGIGGVMLSHCPHCQWDLAVSDIPEPPYSDKMAFLHCLLGEKPFVKEFPLFNGNVLVSFRTLTTRELDVIYKQAYKDRQDGKLPNELDYYERLNRYRMLLQLQKFQTVGPNGFVKDLPDGYSEAANPGCTGTWVSKENEAKLTPDETGIPVIEEWMVEEVLKSEHVFRLVNVTCNQFNRLVSKMEAMADNSDFWNPTGEQS